MGSLKIDRVIGGISVKQICGELDRVAHRPADHFAQTSACRAAAASRQAISIPA